MFYLIAIAYAVSVPVSYRVLCSTDDYFNAYRRRTYGCPAVYARLDAQYKGERIRNAFFSLLPIYNIVNSVLDSLDTRRVYR